MYNGKKIVVVLPAYNAELTLEKTYQEIPFDIVDEVILVDDFSKDNTYNLGKKLGIKHIIHHEENKGYGGNQKTCYRKALELDADIAASRLSVYTALNPGNGKSYRNWSLSGRIRFEDIREKCTYRRNAKI